MILIPDTDAVTAGHRLRYQPAWDHDLCRAVVAVYVQAVLGWPRRRARGDGVPVAAAGPWPSSSGSAGPSI